MKKFSKMVLAELGKELNDQEMKSITGGYTGGYYDSSRCGEKVLLVCECIYGVGTWSGCYSGNYSSIISSFCAPQGYGAANARCRKG